VRPALFLTSCPAFVLAASPIGTAAQPALQADRFIDSRAIDAAVRAFTGQPTGEVGGARVPADRRLKLAACDAPLETSWHGRTQSTVKVECIGPEPWRIFIATRPRPEASEAATIVKRGDPITVMIRGRGFTVQQAGEALENGRVGEWIGVRTARKADPVRARIERPGLAVIPVG